MAVTLQALGIDKLSVSDRLDLIDQIWESLEHLPGPDILSPEQDAEIERRLRLADADPQRAIPWQQVQDATLAKLREMRR